MFFICSIQNSTCPDQFSTLRALVSLTDTSHYEEHISLTIIVSFNYIWWIWFCFSDSNCNTVIITKSCTWHINHAFRNILTDLLEKKMNNKWQGAISNRYKLHVNYGGEKAMIVVAYCKRNITPLLMHWSYISFALSHWFVQLYGKL